MRFRLHGLKRLIYDSLGETKVCNLHITVFVKQEVFRLKIPVNEVASMQILKDQRDLGRIELRRNRIKTSSIAEVSKELTSDDVLKHHIQVPHIYE